MLTLPVTVVKRSKKCFRISTLYCRFVPYVFSENFFFGYLTSEMILHTLSSRVSLKFLSLYVVRVWLRLCGCFSVCLCAKGERILKIICLHITGHDVILMHISPQGNHLK